jgi:hypothetical protein
MNIANKTYKKIHESTARRRKKFEAHFVIKNSLQRKEDKGRQETQKS